MIDLNDIAMFEHVVRAGSFAEAARRRGVAANTLSSRIQQLESELTGPGGIVDELAVAGRFS